MAPQRDKNPLMTADRGIGADTREWPDRWVSSAATPEQLTFSLSPTRRELAEFAKSCLSTEERLVVTLHYCEQLTVAEIGAILRVPESSVARIRQDAVSAVRRWLPARRLE